jgi:6-phosphogluconolactonase (cycloisomerase 2 family)
MAYGLGDDLQALMTEVTTLRAKVANYEMQLKLAEAMVERAGNHLDALNKAKDALAIMTEERDTWREAARKLLKEM